MDDSKNTKNAAKQKSGKKDVNKKSNKNIKKEYLNEEKFQKTNKKVKLIGVLILLLGILMIVGGIYLKKTDGYIFGYHDATQIRSFEDLEKYKKESSSEFFNYHVEDSDLIGTGMMFFGWFISMIGLTVRFFIGNAREIGAYTRQQEMPLQQEYMEKMSATAGVVAKEVGKGIKEGMKDDTSSNLREELKKELREELKEELKAELKQELKEKGE